MKLPENYILIFVDPKSAYINDIPSSLNNKIIYINEYVNFTNLLQNVDVYLRPTNFDGNSVATLESISLNIPVLAADSVERNESIFLYKNNNEKDFLEKLEFILKNPNKRLILNIDSIELYIKFCKGI